MKKSDLFKIGVLLMATTLGTTGCSFGEDEKKPEIVVDPAEKTIEYYIAGKVTEGTTALSGVEVKAGEVTATTDAEGAYKLTVDSKKVYTVTFSKQPQGPEKTGTKWQMPFMTRKRTAISSHCPQAHHCPENIRCASRVARPQEKNW